MEKLIKLSDVEKMIKSLEIKNELTYDDIGYNSAIQQILFTLPSIPTQNEWIPITEKEPEPDTNNLVCYYGFNNRILVSEASCDCERNGKDLDFFIGMNPVKITHWQPLPLPPTN